MIQQSVQQNDIKALAARVLERVEHNAQCNISLTTSRIGRNKTAQDRSPIVASNLAEKTTLDQILGEVIRGLPISLDEVKASRLFDEDDRMQISDHQFNREDLRMYIASWLLADKRFPFILDADWEVEINGRPQR